MQNKTKRARRTCRAKLGFRRCGKEGRMAEQDKDTIKSGAFLKRTWRRLIFLCTVAACCAACDDETALGNLLGVTVNVPVYTGCRVVSGNQVDFYFSTDVKVISANVQPKTELETRSSGNTVSLKMGHELAGGEKLVADILVEDGGGNTLNILVPFRTRNDNMPALHINELRFDYTKPRAEFIELKTLTAGNLGAMRLFIISTSSSVPVYEFPPVNVAAGEYILLHLRTLATDTAVDETGADTNLAAAGNKDDAHAGSRDFWIPDNKKLLHKTDVIYLADQDDKILDGILVSENEKAWYKNDEFSKASELLAAQGKWKNKDGLSVQTLELADTVSTTGTTVTKTLNRKEGSETGTIADWYISNRTGGNTPGKTNK